MTTPAAETGGADKAAQPGASSAANAALDVPFDASLEQVWASMDAGKKLAAAPRDVGDADLEARNLVTEETRANWRAAAEVNRKVLVSAERYAQFSNILAQDGSPASTIKLPLLTEETQFVKRYCDTLGQLGGLQRRLGDLSEARKFYSKGATIEKHSDSFGFAASYNMVNYIAVRVELGEAVAQESSSGLPNLSVEIEQAVTLLIRQIQDRGRSRDPWAWADYALLLLLSGKVEEAAQDVPPSYEKYSTAAGVRDIRTTLRVMDAVATSLEAAGDQTALLLRWGIETLTQSAISKGKQVA